ncbi:12781_t:CDS:2, partial [Funneliformis mosseae]
MIEQHVNEIINDYENRPPPDSYTPPEQIENTGRSNESRRSRLSKPKSSDTYGITHTLPYNREKTSDYRNISVFLPIAEITFSYCNAIHL